MRTYYLLLALLISGCNRLKQGNIVEKDFHPAYNSTQMVMVPMYIDKTMIMLPIFYNEWHNESWSVDVRGVNKKGDSLTKTFYISQEQYSNWQIGRFICVDGLCDEDTAYHKIEK